MTCKICEKPAVFDLICEKDGQVAAQICAGPMCQFDLWRVRPNESPSVIPLMNGRCTCGAFLQQVATGSDRLAYRFNNSNKAVFRSGHHRVEPYTDGWKKGSQIVRDALTIQGAWEEEAEKRPSTWVKDTPGRGECSGDNWGDIDEGIDVASEIADVDSNSDRDACSLWKVVESGAGRVIGILILFEESASIAAWSLPDSASEQAKSLLRRSKTWAGIRWLVGHPKAKGAGEAMMAKADEIHRRYKDKSGYDYMHVTSAHAAVAWYRSKGFDILAPAECNEDGPCRCQIMIKAST